jgi:hypothetical protein
MEISQLRSGWNDSAKIILWPARDAGRKRGFSAVPPGRIIFWDANPACCAGLISSCPFGTKQSQCAGRDEGVRGISAQAGLKSGQALIQAKRRLGRFENLFIQNNSPYASLKNPRDSRNQCWVLNHAQENLTTDECG